QMMSASAWSGSTVSSFRARGKFSLFRRLKLLKLGNSFQRNFFSGSSERSTAASLSGLVTHDVAGRLFLDCPRRRDVDFCNAPMIRKNVTDEEKKTSPQNPPHPRR